MVRQLDTPRGHFLFALTLGTTFAAIHTVECLIRGKSAQEWAPAAIGFFVLCIFVYGLVEGVSTLLPNREK